jgi:hypothetical protein
MKWLIQNLGFVIVATIVAISFLRGIFRAAKGGGDVPPRPRATVDPEAAERTRRVQEEIRRKIAERRAAAAAERPLGDIGRSESRPDYVPPLLPRTRIPPVDPFGGPMRRIVKKLEEAAERRFEPTDDTAEREALERQQKLEEQLRALEVTRLAQQRRAADIAAAGRRRNEAIVPIELGGPAGRLRQQLRDPRELRRVVVLREILGAPVALR